MLDNRTLIKLIRDGVKSHYKYSECCAICSARDNLELHHINTLCFLVEKSDIDKEDRLLFREKFIKQYWNELVEHVVTLCEEHHTKLHKIYGSKPPLTSAQKQLNWIEIQRSKFDGSYIKPVGLSRFKT